MSAPRVIDRDRGWKAILKQVESLAGDSYVKVGVLADTEKGGLHAVDPETGKASDLSVAEIAAVMEFGTEDKHTPARPFLRPTFDEQREQLVRISFRGMLAILDGKMSVGQVLGLLGTKLAAETKKTITAGEEVQPTNAPSTKLAKAMKGRTARFFKREAKTIGDALAQAGALAAVRTLIDTGRMVGAITWIVVEGSFGRGLSGKSFAPTPNEPGTV